MKPFLLYLTFLVLVMCPMRAEEPDRIIPSAVRQTVLDEAQLYSQYPLRLDPIDLSNVHLRFLSKEDALIKVSEKEAVLDTKTLTEEQVLTAAVGILKPRGVIARKGVYHLILPKGPVKAGTRLKIKIDTQAYTLVLAAIHNNFYTLQYKAFKKSFSLNAVTPSGALSAANASQKALKK